MPLYQIAGLRSLDPARYVSLPRPWDLLQPYEVVNYLVLQGWFCSLHLVYESLGVSLKLQLYFAVLEYPKNIPWNIGARVFSCRFPGFWLANQMIGGILWNIAEYCGILRNMVEYCGISHEIRHIGCSLQFYQQNSSVLSTNEPFRNFTL